MTSRVVIAAAVAIAGCKSERAASEAAAAPAVAIDVAAVNALVPPALRDRLVFERRELAVERGAHRASYALAAPRDWVQSSKLFAHLRPAGATARAPRFEVGDNCDGPCTAKPWEVIADRVNFAPLARGVVRKDDHVAGRRTMIAELAEAGATTTHVVVAWWSQGEHRYHVCTAILDGALADAAPAFDKACQAVAIRDED
jgi:hypothetical protein